MELDPYLDLSDQPTIFVVIVTIIILLIILILGWTFLDWYVNVASNPEIKVYIGR